MVRPLFLQFPDDPQCQLETVTFLNFPKYYSYMLQVKVEGEFMFGPDWLVVPITQPKVSQWKVYLPRWNVQIIYILHAYLYYDYSYADY